MDSIPRETPSTTPDSGMIGRGIGNYSIPAGHTLQINGPGKYWRNKVRTLTLLAGTHLFLKLLPQ
jgi:hypothetical protein